MRILNLYAGIGGNRTLWDGHEITAIENDSEIAKAYSDRFPQDEVIVGDAHQYLLTHFSEYDFVWSSPPCPTHGQYRFNVGVRAKNYAPVYPDMQLYEEIILLQHHMNGLWIVENTISYYRPLIPPVKLGRHYVWSNFNIEPITIKPNKIRSRNKISDWNHLGISLAQYRIKNKRQVLRNAVDARLGEHVLNASQKEPLRQRSSGIPRTKSAIQTTLEV